MTDTFDRDAMIAQLRLDEGERLVVYDDHTGEPIRPGVHVFGHPTIGIGRTLDTQGLTKAESAYLLSNDIDAVASGLDRSIPWWRTLDAPRQRVLLDMTFNLGMTGFMEFRLFLGSVQAGNYAMAAEQMMQSKWAGQVKSRAVRLSAQMRGNLE